MRELCVCVNNDNDSSVTPFETIDAIKKAGFNTVFVQWYDKEWQISQKSQVEYTLAQGLKINFAHLGYQNINDIWYDKAEGEALVERYCRNIKDCHELGIDRVVMHLQGKNYELPYGPIGYNRLQRIVDYAETLGVMVSFENTKLQSALDASFSNVKGDNIGLCYDLGHNHCNFNDSIQLEWYKGRIEEIHLHDNHGNFKDEHLLPFDGDIDWPKAMKEIAENGYQREITLELCYRRDYVNQYSVEDFYKEGYKRGLQLLKMFEEYAK